MQLDLFQEPVLSDQEKCDKIAYELLDLLNMDLKPKDIFHPQFICDHEDLIVLIVSTKDKNAVGNIITNKGEIPKGFCVNWRNLSIIRKELQEYKKTPI